MTPLNGTPLVEMRGISKAFGAIQALKDVDLQLFPGEILGLVGDKLCRQVDAYEISPAPISATPAKCRSRANRRISATRRTRADAASR